MTTHTAAIQKAYIAFFNRPADPLGLSWWEKQVAANGGNLAAVINAFSASQEYKDLYAGMSGPQIVNQLYNNLFGRNAEKAGLEFWVDALNRGAVNVGNIAFTMASGAQGDDAKVMANKVEVAQAFTAELDTTPEILGYSGTAAAQVAREFLSTVGASTDSLTAAKAAVATRVAAAVAAGGGQNGPVGSTFTLTGNIDAPGAVAPATNTNGTSGNDTFSGVLTTTGSTINAGDNLVGGAGTDTFVINAVVDGALTSNAVTGSSIEVVQYKHTDAEAGTARAVGVSVGNIAGVTRIETSGSSTLATADTVTFSSVGAGTALKVGSTQLNVTADYVAAATSGTADAASLILSGASKGTVTIGTAGTGFETVNISADGSASRLTALDMGASLTKMVVTGNQTVRIDGTDSTNLKTIDASAMTAGGLNIALGANGADVTFTGGAGNDRVVFDATKFNSNDTVTGGAGTDTLALADADLSDATLLAAIKGAKVTGIEQLETTATGAVTISGNAGAINTFVVSGAGANDVTLTAWDDNDSLVITGNRGNIAGWAPTTDTAGNTALLTLGSTATSGVTIGTVAGGSFEAMTLTSVGAATGTAANTTGVITLGANAQVTATGSYNLEVGGFANAVNFNGSAFTGRLDVTGSGSADVIKGGTGNDTFTGGNGIDQLTGGAGSDIFVFATAAANRDIVTDFQAGSGGDQIRTGALTANNVAVATGTATSTQFTNVASSGNLTGAAGQYIFAVTVENVASFSTDGAAVLNALVTGAGSGTITTANAADVLYFLVSNGTDVGVYRGVAGADTTIAANEIDLVGVLQGVSLASLTAANFQFGA